MQRFLSHGFCWAGRTSSIFDAWAAQAARKPCQKRATTPTIWNWFSRPPRPPRPPKIDDSRSAQSPCAKSLVSGGRAVTPGCGVHGPRHKQNGSPKCTPAAISAICRQRRQSAGKFGIALALFLRGPCTLVRQPNGPVRRGAKTTREQRKNNATIAGGLPRLPADFRDCRRSAVELKAACRGGRGVAKITANLSPSCRATSTLSPQGNGSLLTAGIPEASLR